jgi:hypothetical protein
MAEWEIVLGRPLDRILPIDITNPQMVAMSYLNHRGDHMRARLYYGKAGPIEMKGVVQVFWENRPEEVAEHVIDLPTTRGTLNAGLEIKRNAAGEYKIYVVGTTSLDSGVKDHVEWEMETSFRVSEQ